MGGGGEGLEEGEGAGVIVSVLPASVAALGRLLKSCVRRLCGRKNGAAKAQGTPSPRKAIVTFRDGPRGFVLVES